VGESPPPPVRDLDDLTQAQDDLGRALGRARIGEDRALFNLVRELGERLAHLLAGLLRMTRMHSPDNQAFNQPVSELHRTLVRLHDTLGPIHLVAVEDQVYVNDIRIRGGEKDSGIKELGGELRRHNVGEIAFHEPLDDVSIRGLVGALGKDPATEEPRTALAHDLEAAGVSGLELHGRFQFRMAGGDADEITERQDLLPRALTAIDEAYQNLFAGRVPNPLPLRRVVTELLEADLAAEELWIDPPEAPDLAQHLYRVTQLSLLVGRAAGLSDDVMQDLGLAALYHDCGYAAASTPDAPEVTFEEHPAVGARLLMRQRGFHEAKTRRVLVALQHHQDASAKPRPGLLGRIVRVAEDYDTLSRRSGKLSPTMALATMLKAAGTFYDPVLLQLLINSLGAYPPGTLLQLEDGRIVRCVAPSIRPDRFTTPPARCVHLADGSRVPDPPPVDLRQVGQVRVLRGSV
jgi:hypothetical protein